MVAPVNIHPITPYTVFKLSVLHATANTARDGSGTITTLVTAGANGALVSEVRYVTSAAVTVASTAMVARLWIRVAGAGSWFLVPNGETAIATTTPSNTAIATAYVSAATNIPLGPGDLLGLTQSISEGLYHMASGGHF